MNELWTTAFADALVLLGAAVFVYRRLIRLFHYFQQDEYDSSRFLLWCISKQAFDRRGSFIAVLGTITTWVAISHQWTMSAIYGANAIFSACYVFVAFKLEEDPRKRAKKRLNMTPRMRRLLGVSISALILVGLALLAVVLFVMPGRPLVMWIGLLAIFQILPLFIVFAERILNPDEIRRQAVFRAEAFAKFREVHPVTIGITGSYGKTTTKTFLAHLLRSTNKVFAPPFSINTLMGITRQIREELRDNDKYAVIEMGAYQKGSIHRLCQLVPPNAAIITAVGVMHLERFKNRENVLQAKAELATALPSNGILWLNGNDEFARRIPNVVRTVEPKFYGIVGKDTNGRFDCTAEIQNVTPSGTELSLFWNGREYRLLLQLWGAPILENFVGAFAMAASLGYEPELLCAAALNLKPADHRLEVSRRGTWLYVDDAYNSNPIGFAAALDVLEALPVTQRILITPGMVELGSLQYQENKQAARKAAKICDFVIIVGSTNADSLIAGVEEGKADALLVSAPANQGARIVEIRKVATRDEAFALLNTIAQVDAGILIENDLPDLYETTPQL